jgi:hypothetical protein
MVDFSPHINSNFTYLFLFIVGWGYIVTFTKVLVIYQIQVDFFKGGENGYSVNMYIFSKFHL